MHKQPCWLAVLTSIKRERASCVVQYGRPCRRNPADEPYAAFRQNHFLRADPCADSSINRVRLAGISSCSVYLNRSGCLTDCFTNVLDGSRVSWPPAWYLFFFPWADTMSAPLVPFSVRAYFNSCSDIQGRRRCVLVSLNQKEAQMLMLFTLVTQQQDELFGL